MDPILKKMNWKEGMKIQVWNTPTELNEFIQSWKKAGFVAGGDENPDWMLAFVQTEEEVSAFLKKILPHAPEDQLIWMAYPKGSSKRYQAQINRDSGWRAMGENDLEAVRQIAINEDWSALRFRKIKYIKTMTRKFSTKDQ